MLSASLFPRLSKRKLLARMKLVDNGIGSRGASLACLKGCEGGDYSIAGIIENRDIRNSLVEALTERGKARKILLVALKTRGNLCGVSTVSAVKARCDSIGICIEVDSASVAKRMMIE